MSVIETIDDNAFCRRANIRQVSLVNCGITSAPNVTPLKKSLRSLILNNNHIKGFPSSYFGGLELCHLEVNGNWLISVPHIVALAPSLTELSLSKNRISTLSGPWLRVTYNRLQSIDASQNMISSVNTRIRALKLTWLDLRNNTVRTMEDPESSVLVVDLRENPLHCDDAMLWAARIGALIGGARCASPACAAGRELSGLGKILTHFDGLVQERRNSIALAMELRLSCTKHRFVLGSCRCDLKSLKLYSFQA